MDICANDWDILIAKIGNSNIHVHKIIKVVVIKVFEKYTALQDYTEELVPTQEDDKVDTGDSFYAISAKITAELKTDPRMLRQLFPSI